MKTKGKVLFGLVSLNSEVCLLLKITSVANITLITVKFTTFFTAGYIFKNVICKLFSYYSESKVNTVGNYSQEM